MRLLFSSPAADADIERILAWSGLRFGTSARTRYRALIRQALLDIAADPHRTGVRACDEVAVGVLSYHLRHSRARSPEGVVRAPRHVIFFRPLNAEMAPIVRVLHDAMDAALHLPEGLRE